MALELSSPAFGPGERIPPRYTADGEDVSPPLRWSGVPEGTRGFVVVVDDPDAPRGTFGHWAVFGIPADWRDLPEDLAHAVKRSTLTFGRNDMGEVGYSGPAPPRGHGVHHYRFRLAAIDIPTLDIPPGTGVLTIWREATKHALGQTELVGLYQRS